MLAILNCERDLQYSKEIKKKFSIKQSLREDFIQNFLMKIIFPEFISVRG